MTTIQAPTEQEIIEQVIAYCKKNDTIAQLIEHQDAISQEIQRQVAALYPYFAHACGGLPVIARRKNDKTLYIQPGILAHELPSLEADQWLIQLNVAREAAQEQKDRALIDVAITVRTTVFNVLHAKFLTSIEAAHGGMLQ